MQIEQLKNIIEAVLLASTSPLNIDKLLALFSEDEEIDRGQLDEALKLLAEDCLNRGVELKEVRSGYRLQIKQDYIHWVSKLWLERPARYSRALLETLSLVAYRQPVTRAEIEQVRGVSVSSNIIKTLQERNWVKVVGHRDVPGKPALYATTKEFLDHFNLKSLAELPPLSEIRDIDSINAELELEVPASVDDKDSIKSDESNQQVETDNNDTTLLTASADVDPGIVEEKLSAEN